ncbi:alpha/beta hydrolase family protein [Olegusella massiliensis]|uniref:hypothetical protein n=1 Tax=Olegusella massiliensis TaxID=1776381 RepID=UPI000AAFA0AC|nr:hypothetical protein [Olegusella massiliensis]
MPRPVAVVLGIVGVAGFALYMASTIAHPQGNDLKAERQWEIDHGLWGDFDLLSQSEYQVKEYDGYELHCSFVPAEHTSNKYVIISHGFCSNRYGAAKYVASYRKLGFNCIIYDIHAHGENASTTCTLGNLESEDLLALIQDTHQRYGKDITLGLHGESMGSATMLSALGKVLT